MVTRVKICGLTRPQDAELAIELGADALGFIHERKSKRFIGDGEHKWIAALAPIPLKVAVFGIVDRPVAKGLFDAIQGVEWSVYPEPSTKRIHVIRPREGQKPEDIMNGVVPASAIHIEAYSSDAYVEAAHRSIQIFGAIGFTWEMENHLYLKRARANAELFGAARDLRRRVIDMACAELAA